MNIKKTLIISSVLLSLVIIVTGCEQQGPAEKAGEKLDQKVEQVKDATESDGPLEKAGQKTDNAIEKAKETLN